MGPPQQSRGGGRDAKTTALTSPPPELLGALLDALRRQELHTCKTTTACTNYTGRAPSSLHQAAHTHSLTHTRQHLQHAHYTYSTWGGGEGYTIYDALADDPDDPADASAQGVLAGRGYTAPGRQGHPASGPGTMHASRAQPGPLAG